MRKLLIQQLIDEWQQINYLYTQQNWFELNKLLHKLLGSAKICAASLLVHQIKNLKTKIKTNKQDNFDLQQLKLAIDKTIQFDDI